MNPAPASEQDTQLLRQAFDSFAEISSSLEKAYQRLQNKVRRLSLELEKSNEYLETVLHSLPCGVIVIDGRQVVRTINPRASELLGAAESGAEGSIEWRALPLSVSGLLSRLPDDPSLTGLLLEDDPPREVELRKPARRVLSCACSRTKRGERLLVIQDVTELRDLQNQMQKAERLAAMGEMALELAHEIRNPLTGLSLFASLLREEGLSAAERNRYLDHIEIGIRSLDTVLCNMFSFSKNRPPCLQPLFLDEVLGEVLRFMSPLIAEKKIRLVEDYSARRQVKADAEMVRQAFMNLVLNAMQALPEGGVLEAAAEAVPEGVRVRIRDDGIGIPEELHETVFEPRFTTTAKGNGLGLGIAKKIVEAHGGSISLRSSRGRGTEFRLLFPASPPAATLVGTASAAAAGGVQ